MVEILERFEPPTELVISPHVTASQLTAYMDELVDAQVHTLAALYQRLIADFEWRSRHITRAAPDAWLTKSCPPGGAAEPSAIRRRLERLPARPPNDDDRSDIPDFRPARERGVYLRLTSGCYRNADMRAYDRRGQQIDRACVVDDAILRLGAARHLWSVLEWQDPLPPRARGRR